MKILVEKYLEKDRKLFVFMDLEAYDRVARKDLWKDLERQIDEDNLIRVWVMNKEVFGRGMCKSNFLQ